MIMFKFIFFSVTAILCPPLGLLLVYLDERYH